MFFCLNSVIVMECSYIALIQHIHRMALHDPIILQNSLIWSEYQDETMRPNCLHTTPTSDCATVAAEGEGLLLFFPGAQSIKNIPNNPYFITSVLI